MQQFAFDLSDGRIDTFGANLPVSDFSQRMQSLSVAELTALGMPSHLTLPAALAAGLQSSIDAFASGPRSRTIGSIPVPPPSTAPSVPSGALSCSDALYPLPGGGSGCRPSGWSVVNAGAYFYGSSPPITSVSRPRTTSAKSSGKGRTRICCDAASRRFESMRRCCTAARRFGDDQGANGLRRHFAASPTLRSIRQQDRQGLPVRDFGARLQFRQGAAADRMPNHQEGIVCQAHDSRDVLRGDLEGLGAQHHRPFTQLFEADAVMQTAR